MTIRELAERLAQDCESVVSYLMPAGKREGSEWCVGSLSGNPGHSLKIKLSGPKAGLWCDFASSDKGDLVDLWRLSKSISMSEACREIRDWLKIPEPQVQAPKKTYVKPKPSGTELSFKSPVCSWLFSRGLTSQTISAFQVREKDGAVIFPYYRDGILFHEKYRMTDQKKFWSSKETEPILFGWQALPDDARSICLTEGELDTMALHQYGFPALSIPYGAGNGGKLDWIEAEYERLSLFDEIFICMDMDEAGQACVPDLVQRLGRERCRIVKLPKKDVNDCLKSGIGSLDEWFSAAESLDPEGLHPASFYFEEAMQRHLGTDSAAKGIPFPWSDNLRFRPHDLTVWNGYNGNGKTTLMNHLSLILLDSGHPVLYCSHEMPPHVILDHMLKQASGSGSCTIDRAKNFINSLFSKLIFYTGKKNRIEDMKYAVRRYGCTHIVIDNLTMLLPQDDYHGQHALMEELKTFKNSENVHIHLLTHPRKTESESQKPDKMDIRGAGAISDITDNVATIHRNIKKEDHLAMDDEELASKRLARYEVHEWPDARIFVQKQRETGWSGTIKLWFDPVSKQFGGESGFRPREFDRYDYGSTEEEFPYDERYGM